jgi:hypothetical protein
MSVRPSLQKDGFSGPERRHGAQMRRDPGSDKAPAQKLRDLMVDPPDAWPCRTSRDVVVA